MTPRGILQASSIVLAGMIAAPAGAQTLGQGTDTDVPGLRLLAALTVCVILAGVAAWALRARLRQGGLPPGMPFRRAFPMSLGPAPWLERLTQVVRPSPQPDRRLKAVETLHLAHASVSLFRCDARDFILASSPQGGLTLVTLSEKTDGQEGPCNVASSPL